MDLINKILQRKKATIAETLQANNFCYNLFIPIILPFKILFKNLIQSLLVSLYCEKLTIWQLGKNNFDKCVPLPSQCVFGEA